MLICMLYIPFFTVDALAIYYQIKTLHHLWHTYVMQLYGMSRFGKYYFLLLLQEITYVATISIHFQTLRIKVPCDSSDSALASSTHPLEKLLMVTSSEKCRKVSERQNAKQSSINLFLNKV